MDEIKLYPDEIIQVILLKTACVKLVSDTVTPGHSPCSRPALAYTATTTYLFITRSIKLWDPCKISVPIKISDMVEI